MPRRPWRQEPRPLHWGVRVLNAHMRRHHADRGENHRAGRTISHVGRGAAFPPASTCRASGSSVRTEISGSARSRFGVVVTARLVTARPTERRRPSGSATVSQSGPRALARLISSSLCPCSGCCELVIVTSVISRSTTGASRNVRRSRRRHRHPRSSPPPQPRRDHSWRQLPPARKAPLRPHQGEPPDHEPTKPP